VIHPVEDGDVHVAEIARHEDGRDLPPTFGQHLVAAGPTLEHDEDRARLVAFANKVNVGANVNGAGARGSKMRRVDIV